MRTMEQVSLEMGLVCIMSMYHEMLGSKDVITWSELLVPIPMGKDVKFIQPLVPQGEPPLLLLVVNVFRINRT